MYARGRWAHPSLVRRENETLTCIFTDNEEGEMKQHSGKRVHFSHRDSRLAGCCSLSCMMDDDGPDLLSLEGSNAEYLESSALPAMLKMALDEMINTCDDPQSHAARDPVGFIAEFLKSQNPRRNAEASRRMTEQAAGIVNIPLRAAGERVYLRLRTADAN
jgi:hypothetical protein